MQHLRLAPTTLAALLGSSILFACDPEQDFSDDEMADAPELDELGLDDGQLALGDIPSELDIEAPSNEQQTTEEEMVCNVWGPSNILANKFGVGTAEIGIWIPGVTAYVDFDLTQQYLPYISSFDIKQQNYPYTVLASSSTNLGWHPFVGRAGDTYDLTMRAPSNAAPGTVYSAKLKLSGGGGQCTDLYVNLRIANCTAVGWWSTNPWPQPQFDNANCYVAPLPQGQTSFVWNNSWYVQETNGNQCAVGVFDGANCYIGSAPGGHTAFIWNNALYYTP
jgi:hypothetical protein